MESSVDYITGIAVDGVFQLRLKSVGICQQYSEVSHKCINAWFKIPFIWFDHAIIIIEFWET